MVAVVDAFPYPWPDPAAQLLHITLTQLFPSRQALTAVAQKADVDMTFINSEQAPAYIWIEILDAAAAEGLTRQLVGTATNVLRPTNPRRSVLEDFLAGAPIPTEGEPRSTDGEPRFIRATDEVSEPEALLYYDDLTLQIGRVPALIETLQRLVLLAPAVCKLNVTVQTTPQEGTGFRIAPDLLLTNWHVVYVETTGQRATSVTAEFGYEDDGEGGIRNPTLVPCDVTSIVSNQSNDWAVLRPQVPLDDAWPIVSLAPAATPVLHTPAFVIQHPQGARKRLGFVRNQVSLVDDRVVQYLTDTEVGSSGSPVFDAAGGLIAVHHAGGRPQEVVGKPPTKKNEGIRASRILADLAAAGVAVP